jgi:hypothetical protein
LVLLVVSQGAAEVVENLADAEELVPEADDD